MRKVEISPFRPIYPTPAALITCVGLDGTPNIIALGEVYNLGLRSPTIVGIGIHKARYSHQLITATREYVVNLPTSALLDKVDACGNVSGRDVDKFSEFGLTPTPAKVVSPPLIEECPVNIECKVIDIHVYGDHDTFAGEVVAAHVDQDLLDSDGRLLAERLDPICFLFSFGLRGEYWSLGSKLGSRGQSRRR